MELNLGIFLVPTFLTCLLFYENANLLLVFDGWRENILGPNGVQTKPTWILARQEFVQGIETLKNEFPHQSL